MICTSCYLYKPPDFVYWIQYKLCVLIKNKCSSFLQGPAVLDDYILKTKLQRARLNWERQSPSRNSFGIKQQKIMTRPCGYVGQKGKEEKLTKDVMLYLGRSSKMYIIQNNWLNIAKLIKNFQYPLDQLFYSLKFTKMK